MGLKEMMANAMMGSMGSAKKLEMMSAMMDRFVTEMSGEEKQKLMAAMMDRFMAGVGAEEKLGMMTSMMPRMMGGAEGASGGMGMMMPMMSRMMGGSAESKEGDMPWDMCKKMMSAIGKSSDLATFATPEVKGLFEEWAGQIETEILAFIQEPGPSGTPQIAERFRLSTDSVHYFLNRLAQKGKITLRPEKTA